MEVSGVRNFLRYPRCHTESGLVKHLNAWEKALAKYGQGLLQTPETLRILVLGILPKALETKLTQKRKKYPPDLPVHCDVLQREV